MINNLNAVYLIENFLQKKDELLKQNIESGIFISNNPGVIQYSLTGNIAIFYFYKEKTYLFYFKSTASGLFILSEIQEVKRPNINQSENNLLSYSQFLEFKDKFNYEEFKKKFNPIKIRNCVFSIQLKDIPILEINKTKLFNLENIKTRGPVIEKLDIIVYLSNNNIYLNHSFFL